MSEIDFVQQLEKQLRYIETSANEYDAGKVDEAIRIATCLRVIFRQAKHSTSLLTHLQANHINLLRAYTSDRLSHMRPAIGIPSWKAISSFTCLMDILMIIHQIIKQLSPMRDLDLC